MMSVEEELEEEGTAARGADLPSFWSWRAGGWRREQLRGEDDRDRGGCWVFGDDGWFGWPVVEAPAAVWLGGGRFCGAASPLLLIAGRGSVDDVAGFVGVSLRLAFLRPREAATGETVSGQWRGWNRLGEGRGREGYGRG
ncbi:hypothetical protein POTOM_061588 [Populus tomentosa]|uniref:Uncharacterized protein n=1 Tax=Populus tomentosa TaxID=118781 RepID=A0A8X7XQE7_POPTO|nr:hypothetical protein POTOM_061588 [Populus tomentosa]